MIELVLTELDRASGIATLTLNRPEARNPTSIALLDAMDAGLDRIEAEADALRVLILAGAGKSFCAGLDLDEVRGDTATIHTLLRRLSEVMRRIRRIPIPTIARVQGAAIGGGFGFLAACDFTITHPEAKIGYPALATCLSPALMAPWLMRKIGPSPARAMQMRGGTITGAEAFAKGIVTHLVPRDELESSSRELANELITSGRFAARAMKQFLNDLDGSMDDAWLDRAAIVSAEVIAHPESQAKLNEALGGK